MITQIPAAIPSLQGIADQLYQTATHSTQSNKEINQLFRIRYEIKVLQ